MKVESQFQIISDRYIVEKLPVEDSFWIFDYKTALFNHTIYFKTNQLKLHRRQ